MLLLLRLYIISSHPSMSYQNSPKQSSSSQGSASEQFIKIVEQLIDSDDDETIMKKMNDLQPIFPVLKKMLPGLTNQQKVNIFLRDSNFRMRLTDKLRQNGQLLFDPFVKLHLYTIRHCLQITEQFDQQDLQNMCQKFGQVVFMSVDKHIAYVRFDNYVACYLMMKALNGLEVNDNLRMAVGWCNQEDFNAMQNLFAASSITPDAEEKKSMGRYEIYLQTNNQFKISKRIIGPRGNHMKKILTDVLAKSKMQHLPIESIAKIRLRGRGSGFLQGQSNIQSDEVLNLCISSKNITIFRAICEQVQKLLYKISMDYKDYYFKTHKKSCEGIAYRKYQLRKNDFEFVQQVNLEQINSALDFLNPIPNKKDRLKQNQIIRMINQRDRARKQGRFRQADLIRDELKRQGVLLIDEKHTNGHMCKTTWKYLGQ